MYGIGFKIIIITTNRLIDSFDVHGITRDRTAGTVLTATLSHDAGMVSMVCSLPHSATRRNMMSMRFSHN